jgi:hypothetical protein
MIQLVQQEKITQEKRKGKIKKQKIYKRDPDRKGRNKTFFKQTYSYL